MNDARSKKGTRKIERDGWYGSCVRKGPTVEQGSEADSATKDGVILRKIEVGKVKAVVVCVYRRREEE